jgi:hypothetical protein
LTITVSLSVINKIQMFFAGKINGTGRVFYWSTLSKLFLTAYVKHLANYDAQYYYKAIVDVDI